MTELAERVGFEPTEVFTSLVFKTSSLNHSDTSPYNSSFYLFIELFYKDLPLHGLSYFTAKPRRTTFIYRCLCGPSAFSVCADLSTYMHDLCWLTTSRKCQATSNQIKHGCTIFKGYSFYIDYLMLVYLAVSMGS